SWTAERQDLHYDPRDSSSLYPAFPRCRSGRDARRPCGPAYTCFAPLQVRQELLQEEQPLGASFSFTSRRIARGLIVGRFPQVRDILLALTARGIHDPVVLRAPLENVSRRPGLGKHSGIVHP